MIVYVVCTVTDYEYGGFKINFVTTDEEKARNYVKCNNDPWIDYTGEICDSTFIKKYEVEN